MSAIVELIVEDPGWQTDLPDLHEIAEAAAAAALAEAGVDPAGREIGLLACDDDRISVLNAEFRGRPQPTNVLSWPAHALPLPAGGRPPDVPPGPLGDLALARGTVLREAQAADIPLKNHATHLILHGVLHLLGYDHEDESAAEVMESTEVRALNRLGVPDPYR